VTGAAIRLEGQVLVWRPGGEGACYRCLYRDAEVNTETCAQPACSPGVGVIGSCRRGSDQGADRARRAAGRTFAAAGRRRAWNGGREGKARSGCPVCAVSGDGAVKQNRHEGIDADDWIAYLRLESILRAAISGACNRRIDPARRALP